MTAEAIAKAPPRAKGPSGTKTFALTGADGRVILDGFKSRALAAMWGARQKIYQGKHTPRRKVEIAPRREHSRNPYGIHERIERLVAGAYLELFARQSRPGWTTRGDERTKFDRAAP